MSDTQATTIVQIQKSLDRLRAARDELIAVAADRLRLLTHQMLRKLPDVHRWEQTDDVMQKAVLRLCRTGAGSRTPGDGPQTSSAWPRCRFDASYGT